MNQKIKINKIQCKNCKEVLVSEHRHDFKFCKCGKCAVDGGKDYLKRCFVDQDGYTELSESEEK